MGRIQARNGKQSTSYRNRVRPHSSGGRFFCLSGCGPKCRAPHRGNLLHRRTCCSFEMSPRGRHPICGKMDNPALLNAPREGELRLRVNASLSLPVVCLSLALRKWGILHFAPATRHFIPIRGHHNLFTRTLIKLPYKTYRLKLHLISFPPPELAPLQLRGRRLARPCAGSGVFCNI